MKSSQSNHGKDANANLDETHIHDDDDDACAGKVDEGLKERKKINDDTGSVDEVWRFYRKKSDGQ